MANAEWREFELLVARLEQWLGPNGVEITSPDHIADRVTGVPREVDASLRYHVGSAPILVTVECRDRAGAQDVTWIEQIASKRDSIGAARTIAVSSHGFTGPARIKAESLGIELRHVRDVTRDVAGAWIQGFSVYLLVIRWNLIALSLRQRGVLSAAATDGGLSDEVASEFARDPNSARIGYEKSSSNPLTVRSIVNLAIETNKEFTADLAPNGPSLRKTLTVTFPEDSFAFFTARGERDLEEMIVTADVWMTQESPPPFQIFNYESADKSVLQVARTDIQLDNMRSYTMLVSPTPPA